MKKRKDSVDGGNTTVNPDKTLKGGQRAGMSGDTLRRGDAPSHGDVSQGDTVAGSTLRGMTPPSTAGRNAAPPAHTLRPDDIAAQTASAGSPSHAVPIAEGDAPLFIEGRAYKRLRVISDNSGEAQVMLVERDGEAMALKLYYPDVRLNKEVARLIYNADFDMIVRLYAFGTTFVGGVRRDYELMEYLPFGSLAGCNIGGDSKRFRRIALQASAALAYCHNLRIIHKDIKPSNIFFRDKEHSRIALGDFGIAALMGPGETTHRTTQARTPLYAAPEMYSDVIDGEVEITQAADYYSLGLTLLALWTGKRPFEGEERSIMHRKNEGRLPGIDSLPERERMAVRGLTTVNVASRWTYNEVEQWFLGNDPDVDLSSPLLKYKAFVVDPERNMVAETVADLIPMLLSNERLACGYLYSGKLAKWFESCGNTRVSALLTDIVAHKMPADQTAGLYLSVYAIDPKWPYTDVAGDKCADEHAIAATLLAHADEYGVALRNPHDRLWLYVESHFNCDIRRLQTYIADDSGETRIALRRIALEIDPSMPLLPDAMVASATDITEYFGSGKASADEWRSLTDGRLLSWLYRHADSAVYEPVRTITEGKEYSDDLAYEVIYEMDRSAPYDLRDADTPDKIGALMARRLMEWQHLEETAFADAIAEFSSPTGRLAYYARMHGWTTVVEQMERCFDIDGKDNRERLGAYDTRTAAYRFCRIMGSTPGYALPSGAVLTDDADIPKDDNAALREELANGSLAQWLAVFYHENPAADFSKEYDYERALGKWLDALSQIDPHYPYCRRYAEAREAVRRQYEAFEADYRNADRRVRAARLTAMALAIVWLLTTAGAWMAGKAYHLGGGYPAAMLPVGIVSALLFGKHAYFRGYGALMTGVWALGGFLSSLVPLYIIRGAQQASAAMPAVVIISVAYMAVCLLTDNAKAYAGDKAMVERLTRRDERTWLVEPLYYTFRTKTRHYSGSRFGAMDDMSDHYTSASTETFLHYVLWSLMALALTVEVAATYLI